MNISPLPILAPFGTNFCRILLMSVIKWTATMATNSIKCTSRSSRGFVSDGQTKRKGANQPYQTST